MENSSVFNENMEVVHTRKIDKKLPLELQEELNNLSNEEFAVSAFAVRETKSFLEQLISRELPLPKFLTPYQEGNIDLVLIEWNNPKICIVTIGNPEEIKMETANHKWSLPPSHEVVIVSIQKLFK